MIYIESRNALVSGVMYEAKKLARSSKLRLEFNPIIDLKDNNEVFGYDANFVSDWHDPKKYIEKFIQVENPEQLEAFAYFETINNTIKYNYDKTIFIPSLPCALLGKDEVKAIKKNVSPDLMERTGLNLMATTQLDFNKQMEKKRRCHDNGTLFAVNDVGTGSIGVKDTMRLKPDAVFLNETLCEGLNIIPGKKDLARTLIQTFLDNNITVIAKGIYLTEQLTFLIDQGVRYVQGPIVRQL